MSKIIIGKMLDTDFSAVMNIYNQDIQTNIATFQTICPSFEDCDKSHIKNCRFVAKIQDNIVGWIALSPVASCCAYSGVAEISLYVANTAKR